MSILDWIEGDGSVDMGIILDGYELASRMFYRLNNLDILIPAAVGNDRFVVEPPKIWFEKAAELSCDMLELVCSDPLPILNIMDSPFFDTELEGSDTDALKAFAAGLLVFYVGLWPTGGKSLNIARLSKVNLALAKLAYACGKREALLGVVGVDSDNNKTRTGKSTRSVKRRKAEKKQKIIESYYSIEGRSEMKPYSLARFIRERLRKNGPKDTVPSQDTIVRRLREENLIKTNKQT